MDEQDETKPIDVEAIEARANAATPGPWSSPSRLSDTGHDDVWSHGTAKATAVVTCRNGVMRWNRDEDRLFVTWAREDVPALCEALRAWIARAVQAEASLAASKGAPGTPGSIIAAAALAHFRDTWGNLTPVSAADARARFGASGPINALAYVEGRGIGRVEPGSTGLVVRLAAGDVVDYGADGVWVLL